MPDRAPFRPIQFQNASPREKEKAWRGGNGAREAAPSPRGAGGQEVEKWVRAEYNRDSKIKLKSLSPDSERAARSAA